MKTLFVGLVLLTATVCNAKDVVFGDSFRQGVLNAYLDKVEALLRGVVAIREVAMRAPLATDPQ